MTSTLDTPAPKTKAPKLPDNERGGFLYKGTEGRLGVYRFDVYEYQPTEEARKQGHGGPYIVRVDVLTCTPRVASCTCPARVPCAHMKALEGLL